MSCQQAVYQWTEVITTHMPHLSKPQAAVLALWSLGMVLARSCGLSAVSTFLAVGLARKPNTVRQQLREFCYEAKAKRGGPRQALAVETCFAPLVTWVLRWWEGEQLALALDATTLGQRFVVLVISVVSRVENRGRCNIIHLPELGDVVELINFLWWVRSRKASSTRTNSIRLRNWMTTGISLLILFAPGTTGDLFTSAQRTHGQTSCPWHT
jgi:hypothetical protein